MEKSIVTGIAHEGALARITLHNMENYHESTVNVLKAVARANINVKLFTQSYIDHENNSFTIVISRSNYEEVWKIITELGANKNGSHISGDADLARISVIGVGMKSHAGVASKVVDILIKHQIPLNYVSCSEINISCMIPETECEKAVLALHNGFNLDEIRRK